MWSGNGPIKTIDSPGYAEALRMAQAEDETLGIRNIYGTRSSKEITVVESMFANFFSGFVKVLNCKKALFCLFTITFCKQTENTFCKI